jgi:PAS domain S-box-containing protein
MTALHGASMYLFGTSQDITEMKQIEHILRDSESMLKGLFEHSPDAIVLVNEGGNFIRVNQQTEKMFGYHRSELIGRQVEMLIPDTLRIIHVDHRKVYTGNPHTRSMGKGLDLKGLRKNGSLFPVDIMLSPLRTDDQVLTIAVIRDTTERKRAEEALEIFQRSFQEVVEGSLDVIIASDTNRRITLFNKAAEETFQYKRDEVLGHDVQLLYAFPKESENVHVAIASKDQYVGEIVNRRKNGDVFPSFLSATVLRDNKDQIIGYMGISRDISERKQAEAQARDAFRKEVLLKEIHHRVKNNL